MSGSVWWECNHQRQAVTTRQDKTRAGHLSLSSFILRCLATLLPYRSHHDKTPQPTQQSSMSSRAEVKLRIARKTPHRTAQLGSSGAHIHLQGHEVWQTDESNRTALNFIVWIMAVTWSMSISVSIMVWCCRVHRSRSDNTCASQLVTTIDLCCTVLCCFVIGVSVGTSVDTRGQRTMWMAMFRIGQATPLTELDSCIVRVLKLCQSVSGNTRRGSWHFQQDLCRCRR